MWLNSSGWPVCFECWCHLDNSVCVLCASLCLMLTLFCGQKAGWPRIQRSIADITFLLTFLFTLSVSFRVRLCYVPCQDDPLRWMSLSQCASPLWTRAWTVWPCSPARSVCITLLTPIMQRGQKMNFQTQRTGSTTDFKLGDKYQKKIMQRRKQLHPICKKREKKGNRNS